MRQTFKGWYYKQHSNGRTLALIPGKSSDGAFIQVITDKESFYIPFDMSEYNESDILRIGNNEFSSCGVKVNIKNSDITIYGELSYSNLTPINGDIMGPFRFFPMECRHGIVSMKHNVTGEIELNGEKFSFDNDIGYIETDSGKSFPDGYTWIQSSDFKENCSVMASVAKIPFAGFSFWGSICVVWLDGKEYRLATYKGAKIKRCENGLIELIQGDYNFKAIVDQHRFHNLAAPKAGAMSRTIKESVSCPAKFLFTKGNTTLFSGKSKYACYEYAMS